MTVGQPGERSLQAPARRQTPGLVEGRPGGFDFRAGAALLPGQHLEGLVDLPQRRLDLDQPCAEHRQQVAGLAEGFAFLFEVGGGFAEVRQSISAKSANPSRTAAPFSLS